jgi:hypothetical protein
MLTFSPRPCFSISASMLAATSALPVAWQADPEQSVMQGFLGSLCEMISCLSASSSDGEFILGIIFPYS